ncbi:hypothetical protein OFM39_30100, partial [Escherichia coli]|nr:hypothetical protein [Escherichia coli]
PLGSSRRSDPSLVCLIETLAPICSLDRPQERTACRVSLKDFLSAFLIRIAGGFLEKPGTVVLGS